MNKILRLVVEILVELLNDKHDPKFHETFVKRQEKINKLNAWLRETEDEEGSDN